jgi:hypothetical protein
MTTFTVPAGKDIRDTWQWRMLVATRGDGTFKHAILRAAFHNFGGDYPRFGHGAKILKDGVVIAKVATAKGLVDEVRIDTVENIRDAFRRVADEIKLSDEDRGSLFEVLREWMSEDQRAKSGVEGSDV